MCTEKYITVKPDIYLLLYRVVSCVLENVHIYRNEHSVRRFCCMLQNVNIFNVSCIYFVDSSLIHVYI